MSVNYVTLKNGYAVTGQCDDIPAVLAQGYTLGAKQEYGTGNGTTIVTYNLRRERQTIGKVWYETTHNA